jgi:hypothetical protein
MMRALWFEYQVYVMRHIVTSGLFFTEETFLTHIQIDANQAPESWTNDRESFAPRTTIPMYGETSGELRELETFPSVSVIVT